MSTSVIDILRQERQNKNNRNTAREAMGRAVCELQQLREAQEQADRKFDECSRKAAQMQTEALAIKLQYSELLHSVEKTLAKATPIDQLPVGSTL